MTDLLDDSIIGLEANAKAKSIKIKIARPGKGLMLRCDSQLLRQAIKKLVDNAIKFSPEGGTIEIWAHRKPDHSTVISVRDNGPGISPTKLAECLLPFIQEDMSYGRPAEGLGPGPAHRESHCRSPWRRTHLPEHAGARHGCGHLDSGHVNARHQGRLSHSLLT